jgi:hypothetical protein
VFAIDSFWTSFLNVLDVLVSLGVNAKSMNFAFFGHIAVSIRDFIPPMSLSSKLFKNESFSSLEFLIEGRRLIR